MVVTNMFLTEQRHRYDEKQLNRCISLLMRNRVCDGSSATIDEARFQAEALKDMLGKKCGYTLGHSERVAHYCSLAGKNMNLTGREIKILAMSAQLHDFGKIVIPDSILKKPSSLTRKEMKLIRTHPQIGAALMEISGCFSDLLPGVLYHHEQYKGGMGYPNVFGGDEIPLYARIIAVADSYDAMTTDRPYQKGVPKETALERLAFGSGSQFDPKIAASFVNAIGTVSKSVWHFPDLRQEPLLPA